MFGCSVEQARDQLWNVDGLEGALMRPKETRTHYGNTDIAEQAAALARGIAETQPFIERNKGTALAALLTFIAVNGYELLASQEERADWMLRLGAGLSIGELGQLIRRALVASGPA